MSAASDLEFLLKIQRLLSEGEFVATYKFALLQALADLSVESELISSQNLGLQISVRDIAEKYIEYYWRQSIPYAPEFNQSGILKQNTKGQAAVINSIIKFKSRSSGSYFLARRDSQSWRQLVHHVTKTIRENPLPRLQVIGGDVDDFIYQQDVLLNGCIELRPGVHSSFRSFHGLITNMIRGGWLSQVRRISGNRDLLGERGDLAEFLFGSERRNLDAYRKVMRDHQLANCFYCSKHVRGEGNADHFIPWSRYSVDLGHNFVFSCKDCNNNKSDFLAHPTHIERWRVYNLESSTLTSVFNSKGLAHDANRSRFVAFWAYEQGEQAKAHSWLSKGQYFALDSGWRDAMEGMRAVAETPSDYGTN